MNLTSLKTALRRFGFDDSDPLLEWLNAALHEFEDSFPWPWLEAHTTVNVLAGVNTLVLPADFYKLMSLKIDGVAAKPDYLSVGEFENEIDDLTTPGVPSTFTVVGVDEILLWPTPDTDLTFRIVYRKFIPDLVNPTDEPAIPTRHHYTLVKGGAMLGLQAENEEARARDAQTQWDGDILRAISRWGTKQEAGSDTVRDEAGYGL